MTLNKESFHLKEFKIEVIDHGFILRSTLKPSPEIESREAYESIDSLIKRISKLLNVNLLIKKER